MSTLLARCRLATPVHPAHAGPALGRWLAALAPAGPEVVIEAHRSRRTLGQNAKFHALCADLAHSALTWNGRRRSGPEWKTLLVSGHAHATAGSHWGLGELALGLEGEMIYLREPTAQMDRARSASLIEYAQAFCLHHGIGPGDLACAPEAMPDPQTLPSQELALPTAARDVAP